jgi:hypothetical protein
MKKSTGLTVEILFSHMEVETFSKRDFVLQKQKPPHLSARQRRLRTGRANIGALREA